MTMHVRNMLATLQPSGRPGATQPIDPIRSDLMQISPRAPRRVILRTTDIHRRQ
ncbi:hypothetical protein [Dokdonella sp.]|uniref:hypothetical protein n=1 Tax=Dokdonella sp. TaxID=2291710 RepID=UPI002F3EA6F8